MSLEFMKMIAMSVLSIPQFQLLIALSFIGNGTSGNCRPGSCVGLEKVTLLSKLPPTLLTMMMMERYGSLVGGKTSSKFSLP